MFLYIGDLVASIHFHPSFEYEIERFVNEGPLCVNRKANFTLHYLTWFKANTITKNNCTIQSPRVD